MKEVFPVPSSPRKLQARQSTRSTQNVSLYSPITRILYKCSRLSGDDVIVFPWRSAKRKRKILLRILEANRKGETVRLEQLLATESFSCSWESRAADQLWLQFNNRSIASRLASKALCGGGIDTRPAVNISHRRIIKRWEHRGVGRQRSGIE